MKRKSGLSIFLLCLYLGFGVVAIAFLLPYLAALIFFIAGFGGFELTGYILIVFIGLVLVIAYPLFSKGKLQTSIRLAILIIAIVLCVGFLRFK